MEGRVPERIPLLVIGSGATLQLHASTPNYSLDLEFDCVSTVSWLEWALCGGAAGLFAFI